jgi:hypothetical protein
MKRTDPSVTDQVRVWFLELSDDEMTRVEDAVEYLAQEGPKARRPMVGEIVNDVLPHLKELSIGQSIRILFTFGPDRVPVLLFAGDKAGSWNTWYPVAIREAARLYDEYLRDAGPG